MAGAGYRLFVDGEILTAAQVNTYLEQQAVMVFASASARTTALASVLAKGMVTALLDTGEMERYNGAAWVALETAGYATTATAAGTTTLTVDSMRNQFFTGSTTQTVVLPATSALTLGKTFRIINNSTGAVTVQSSGANTIFAVPANTSAIFTCVLLTGTSAASWDVKLDLPQGGTSGYILTSGGAGVAPSWAVPASATFHGASVYKSALQTITANTDTVLSFGTENYDTDNYHDTVTNNSRMTIPTSYGGKYLVTVNCRVTAMSNQFRIILYKNGVAITLGTTGGEISYSGTNSGTNEGFSASFQLALVATDYLEVVVNVGGTNIDVATAVYSISYLGA